MTCRELIDFLMDFLDGSLELAQKERFEEHLVDCHECQAYLASYQASVKAGKLAFEASTTSVPSDVPEDLIDAIRDSRQAGKRS